MTVTSPVNVLKGFGSSAAKPFAEPRPPLSQESGLMAEPLRTGPEPGGERLSRVLIRHRDRLRVLRLEHVEWIEGAGNYVRFHVGGDTFLYRCPLGDLAARLDPQRFVRIHRSAIVLLDAIEEMRPTESGSYLVRLRSGVQLSMSRRYRRQVFELAGRG